MLATLAINRVAQASEELQAQGTAALRGGDYKKALELYTQAHASFRQSLGERDLKTLTAQSNLAYAIYLAGRSEEALAVSETVLRLKIEVLGENNRGTLTTMSNMVLMYSELGRSREALALNQRVLDLRRKAFGDKDADTLISMNIQGTIYGHMGRISEQMLNNEEVLRLRTEVLGEEHPNTLNSMNNLGSSYRALGRTDDLIEITEKILRVRTRMQGEKHPETLRAMSNLAYAYGAGKRTEEHLALNEKTLRLRTEVLGERHPDTLVSMMNLAASYRAMARTSDELTLEEKALALSLSIHGERHPTTLTIMNNLSACYADVGRSGEERQMREKVMLVRTELLGERHPDTLMAIANLAYSHARADRVMDAAALSARFVDGAEWQRSQPGLSREQRQDLFSHYATEYRQFSRLRALAGDPNEGFRLAELSKGRTLLDSMTEQGAARAGVLPEFEQKKLLELNNQISQLDERLAQTRQAENRRAVAAERNLLTRRYEILLAQLKRDYPRFAQLSDPQLIEAKSLPGLLPEDSIAVSYLLTGSRVSAWVIQPGGTLQLVNLGLAPWLQDAVELLRRASSTPAGLQGLLEEEARRAWRLPTGGYRLLDASVKPPEGAVAVTDEAEIAAWLSERLLAPLREHLQGKPRWIISPDGPLAQLPFELLSLDGQRVLDKVELHYTQSLSVYALAKARQREYLTLPRPRDLLAMGNPEYSASAEPAATRKARLRSASVSSEAQLRDSAPLWQELPGTDAEIRAIRALIPNSDALLRGDASEARLQALNASGQLRQYRYLHFAVHGNLSTKDPALSSLVLSQKNPAPGTDGYVTAAEWPGYDLRSDLTVLSACETGLGSNLSGEGVMGLPFALFVAGNVNTVLSLWPVFDEVTPVFMQRFFARLKAGKSASQALTETKREMAADPKTTHPSNWAPFILVGAG